ncbi:lipid A deacylase LpxR family protein [Marinobacter orientalis]|uniref:lipid A deacylase LpxR family protein n=1 Tax=Marinobacter orientalis TaxID=1928859 RepID=UPI001D193413|nr:lipid A deacylase LpxR family protein [Marinobacter orientalis]
MRPKLSLLTEHLLRPTLRTLLGGLTFSAFAITAQADTFNIAWDNDLFTGTDRGYTNGLKLSYLTASADDQQKKSASLARGAKDAVGFLPGLNSQTQEHALAFSLRQLMVTPADITASEPQLDDLPYAGFLFASTTLWSWDANSITGYGVHLGVVGPESGAEESQKWAHELTGNETPNGWDHQLGTDVLGGVQAAHARKIMHSGSPDDLEQEVSLLGSAMLSSFKTNGRIGLVWRIGQYLPINFVPDYAGTASTIGMPGALNANGRGWSVFLGMGLEYVPYSYLDENSDPFRFDESLVQGQVGIGGTWQWNQLQLAMILRATTGEEETNKDNFSFGTLSLTWAL